MNQRRPMTVEGLATEYFRLALEHRTDLPDSVGGYLDPATCPSFIAVNANQPRCEQLFTIGHELGHYIRDHNRSRRKFQHWLLDLRCETRIGKLYVRYMRHLINRFLPREAEADLIAVHVMQCFAPQTEVRAFLERHPDKIWMFTWSTLVFCSRHPYRFMWGVLKTLSAPKTAA